MCARATPGTVGNVSIVATSSSVVYEAMAGINRRRADAPPCDWMDKMKEAFE